MNALCKGSPWISCRGSLYLQAWEARGLGLWTCTSRNCLKRHSNNIWICSPLPSYFSYFWPPYRVSLCRHDQSTRDINKSRKHFPIGKRRVLWKLWVRNPASKATRNLKVSLPRNLIPFSKSLLWRESVSALWWSHRTGKIAMNAYFLIAREAHANVSKLLFSFRHFCVLIK